MLNATFTLKIQSVKETYDNQGTKITTGDCCFQTYSKDGLEEQTLPFRSKGIPAVAIAEAGAKSTGVAVGYPDLVVVETQHGYKEKRCTLVIRNFIATSVAQSSLPTGNLPTAEPKRELVAVASKQDDEPIQNAPSSVLESTIDGSDIPF